MEEREPSGVLIVDKPSGITSHDVVNKVRRLYGTRRVGHTGTLDPMATGVLVVLVGRAAKAAEYLMADKKCYEAVLRLGLTTDTEDITGTILKRGDKIPSFGELEAVLPRFRGKTLQVPPMYSALKVGGRKLVDLARGGEVVERDAREIEIFSLEASATEKETDFSLNVSCSGGTYIRTLCADIGNALGCGGVMASLRRTETCGFALDRSHTNEELEAASAEERLSFLIPTESLFSACPEVRLSPFFERLCRSGCELEQKKLHISHPAHTRVRLADENGNFFALGETTDTTVKAIKTFVL